MALPEATVQALPPDRIAVALPTGDDGSWREAIERTGRLEIVGVPPELDQQVVEGSPVPEGMDGQLILDQSAIVGASLSEDQVGTPALSLTLDEAGAAAFDAYAAGHVRERVAIVVDGLVVSAPTLQAADFGGQVQISGSFTEAQVRSLLVALTTHPLPTDVTETSWTTAEDGTCPTP